MPSIRLRVSDQQFSQFLSALNNLNMTSYPPVTSTKDIPDEVNTLSSTKSLSLDEIESIEIISPATLPTKLSPKATHVLPACPQQREIYWFIVIQLGCDPSPTLSHPHLGEFIQTEASNIAATSLILSRTLCILKSMNASKEEIASGHDIFIQALERANFDRSADENPWNDNINGIVRRGNT
ncbi:hypothetical protein BDQ17DRAFT_1434998 [Cyathus striatus]|nr:hypothetical protein BDQ17DRAFT_1434998 [Cyathus striatus]